MVEVAYMIERAEPPSPFRRFIAQRVVPAAIDAAGAVESGVHDLGEHVRARPARCLLAAGALGLLTAVWRFNRSRAPR